MEADERSELLLPVRFLIVSLYRVKESEPAYLAAVVICNATGRRAVLPMVVQAVCEHIEYPLRLLPERI
jgi:hypothetical protein